MRRLLLASFTLLFAVVAVLAPAAPHVALAEGDSAWSVLSTKLNGFYFLDANRGWAVGEAGRIISTTDGGVHWANASSGTTSRLTAVTFADTDRGWAVGDGGTILATTDGGRHWTAQTSGTTVAFIGVTFANADYGWAYGGDTVAATTDGGRSWAVSSKPPSLAMTLLDENRGWAAGPLSATTDGGKTWTTQTTPQSKTYSADAFPLLMGISFADANHGWACGSWRMPVGGNYGPAVLSTNDGGQTWVDQSPPQQLAEAYSIAFGDNTHGWVGGFNGIAATTDGGANWTIQSYEDVKTMAAVDATHAWALTDSGVILRTADGGANWTKEVTGPDQVRAAYFSDATHGWAVDGSLASDNGGVFTTADGGLTWISQTLPAGTGPLLDIAFTDPDHGWILGSTGLLTTADGGKTWAVANLPADNLFTGFFALDADHVWVDSYNTIFASADGGRTWTSQVAGKLGVRPDHIVFFDADHGWAMGGAATDTGDVGAMLATSDGGKTWTDQAVPAGTAAFVGQTWVDASHGWVAAQDGTVLATADGGRTWTQQSTGANNLSDIRFIDANRGWAVGFNTIVATTDGGAHWAAQSADQPLFSATLARVFFVDAAHGWAVGYNGTILAYKAPAPSFDDLAGYDWAHDAIISLATEGIIKGVGPGHFSPGGIVSRAQFAALGQRVFGLPAPDKAATFSDVPATHWAYQSVVAMAPYMPGISSTKFGPDGNIDRQNVVAVLLRALSARGLVTLVSDTEAQGILAGVTDAGSIDPAMRPYVATAIKNGIMLGVGDGRFDPRGVLTRAQVAVLLQRLQTNFLSTAGK